METEGDDPPSSPAHPLSPSFGPEVISDDFCPDHHRAMEQHNSILEDVPEQMKENRLPFQIFPDPVEVVLSPEVGLGCPRDRERLPSIVVEPTDVSEVESGELRWPPGAEGLEEDEDLFLEQCIPPANIADWGEEEQEEEEDEEDEEEEVSVVVVNDQQHYSLIEIPSADEFAGDASTLQQDG